MINASATTIRPADTTKHWWEDMCGKVGRRTRRRLRSLGTEFVYMPGAVVMTEGSRANRFSLIIHGEVEVVIEGAVINTLGAGDFFGEIALLHIDDDGKTTMPRTATVRTTRTTRVRELDQAELMTMIDVVPAAASRISRNAIGRLAAVAV